MKFSFEKGSGVAVNFWKMIQKQNSCYLEQECWVPYESSPWTMPCIEHIALPISLSVLCTKKQVLHNCLLGFCKNTHRTWCPKTEKEYPCRKISRELGFGYLFPKSHFSSMLDADPSHVRVRGMRTHQLNTDVTEVRCSWHVFRGWKCTTGHMQLQTGAGKGFCILLHLPLSSSRHHMGNAGVFLQSISFFHPRTV